ncbi:PQQ-like beta-propeller repeat protein [Roseobacter denitrificans]|uniref:PQQ enzyme repeat family protein n=1 Tax=Roseobacter denitrificans (strain ATCC 33942 / OCh 114) TaxID=375451 RepID=Q169E3_ROSDO|nr:PQQ-like beta-propeller repeat protein [Roseobacter denitrificans]ABG31400.1 PQQ enzyme repeat family protein [Roseobacter denitrificans OCh 114]SFG00657.1 PQQ-like domain-containing protein [Roseobacter denitrificans OCh 114]
MFFVAPARVSRPLSLLLAATVFLAACAEDDTILVGKRESVESILNGTEATERLAIQNEERAISLPAVQSNDSWPQAYGSPAFRTAHPALAAQISEIWSADIGQGDGRRQRIVATPVVGAGLIYTLDAEALVSATSPSGQTVWQSDVRPARDRGGQATGGGVAYDSGRVFVSLGYGNLVALDAATGAELWRQRLDGTASGTPTIVDGIVYLTAGDDRGWAVTADEGRLLWQLTASPDVTNVLGAPAPAVAGDLAVFAFGSGEVQAVFRRGGLRRWDASVRGERPGTALGSIGDVTAPPVIVGNRVYVGNQSGRLVALSLESGARIWTANEGAEGNIVAAGDSIFILSDLNELLRLDASDGSRIWGTPLPRFVKDRPRRRAEIYAHHGPILAGRRLYVASNDGFLRSFDPASGALVNTVEIAGGATTSPVVAGGVLYVVSSNGRLHAFR